MIINDFWPFVIGDSWNGSWSELIGHLTADWSVVPCNRFCALLSSEISKIGLSQDDLSETLHTYILFFFIFFGFSAIEGGAVRRGQVIFSLRFDLAFSLSPHAVLNAMETNWIIIAYIIFKFLHPFKGLGGAWDRADRKWPLTFWTSRRLDPLLLNHILKYWWYLMNFENLLFIYKSR